MCGVTFISSQMVNVAKQVITTQNFVRLSIRIINLAQKIRYHTSEDRVEYQRTVRWNGFWVLYLCISSEECRDVKNIHFLSDSPATQYRNQQMFVIMIKKIIPLFPRLESFTWNHSESQKTPSLEKNTFQEESENEEEFEGVSDVFYCEMPGPLIRKRMPTSLAIELNNC